MRYLHQNCGRKRFWPIVYLSLIGIFSPAAVADTKPESGSLPEMLPPYAGYTKTIFSSTQSAIYVADKLNPIENFELNQGVTFHLQVTSPNGENLSLKLASAPPKEQGTLQLEGEFIRFSPEESFIGEMHFDFTITDANGETQVTTVFIQYNKLTLPSDDSHNNETSYLVVGTECFNDLEIHTFEACQFTASSAIDHEHGPKESAQTGGQGWIPAINSPSIWSPYISIDFLRKTRVSKIEFIPVPGKASVESYKLSYSSDGYIFTDACDAILSTGTPVLPQNCRFDSRFARIVITDTTSPQTNLPVAVKTKFYGCDVALSNTKKNCVFPAPTHSTHGEWRHVAFDTKNIVFYFCDWIPRKNKTLCFSSSDMGATWNSSPDHIASIYGYESDTRKMYAWDTKKETLRSSKDGKNWVKIDKSNSPKNLTPPMPLIESNKISPSITIMYSDSDKPLSFDLPSIEPLVE